MKVLLTGSSGQLGREIINSNDDCYEVLIPSRDKLDLSNQLSCEKYIKENKPDYIINAGAFTSVDKAEIEKDLCYAINTQAPITFSKVIKEYGGKLLQISTDYVFDGKGGIPYKTKDSTNPISVYGKSKADAEENTKNILKENSQLVILRTSWLMGKTGNNFINTMLKFHKQMKEFPVVFDQKGAMTSTSDLAKVCWEIIKNWSLLKNHHICHWTCDGITSWYDIAVEIGEIAEKFNLIKKSAKVIPIRSKDYKTLAKRPYYSVLDCHSTKNILNLKPKPWKGELNKIISQIVEIN